MSKYKGILFVILSAVCFGIAPSIAKLSYGGGMDGISAVCIRSALSIPMLFLVTRIRKTSLSITQTEMKKLLVAGILVASTTILLYMSYSYIPVGITTTLHYSYPMVTCVICFLLFKEKLSIIKLIALLLGTAGIVVSAEISDSVQGLTGCILALSSGFCYAFYVVFVSKTNLKHMDTFKFSFYMNVTILLTSFMCGLFKGSFQVHMDGKSLLYLFLAAILISAVAYPLFQVGLRYTDATTATMLSTFEPVTSMLLGSLLLSEILAFPQIFGCLMAVSSVLLISTAEKRASTPPKIGKSKWPEDANLSTHEL